MLQKSNSQPASQPARHFQWAGGDPKFSSCPRRPSGRNHLIASIPLRPACWLADCPTGWTRRGRAASELAALANWARVRPRLRSCPSAHLAAGPDVAYFVRVRPLCLARPRTSWRAARRQPLLLKHDKKTCLRKSGLRGALMAPFVRSPAAPTCRQPACRPARALDGARERGGIPRCGLVSLTSASGRQICACRRRRRLASGVSTRVGGRRTNRSGLARSRLCGIINSAPTSARATSGALGQVAASTSGFAPAPMSRRASRAPPDGAASVGPAHQVGGCGRHCYWLPFPPVAPLWLGGASLRIFCAANWGAAKAQARARARDQFDAN